MRRSSAMSEVAAKSPIRAVGAKALAVYLISEISSGRMGDGVKLPAERHLSEQFGASRGAVRRGLQDLKDRGLITQAVGSGTFVRPGAAQALPPPRPRADVEMSEPQPTPAEFMA